MDNNNKNQWAEEFQKNFLMKDSDCTWDEVPQPFEIHEFIEAVREKDKERLLEVVTIKKVRYGSSLEDVDKGYNQALEDIEQLIKEIYE